MIRISATNLDNGFTTVNNIEKAFLNVWYELAELEDANIIVVQLGEV